MSLIQLHLLSAFLYDPTSPIPDPTRFNSILSSLIFLRDSDDSVYLTPQTINPLISLITNASFALLRHFLYTTLSEIFPLDQDPHYLSVNDLSRTSAHLTSLCDRVALGIRYFLAAGGRSTRTSSRATPAPSADTETTPTTPTTGRARRSSRSSQQRSRCIFRHHTRCAVSSSPDNLEVAHIVPFSIGRNTTSTVSNCFWDFARMFLGDGPTVALQTRFSNLDLVENIILLNSEVHKYFGAGRLALIPDLSPAEQASYDPDTCLEYSVVVEFPPHCRRRTPVIHKDPPLPNSRFPERILAGDSLTLSTETPRTHPLPHPALLYLHGIISRIIGARGSAELREDVCGDFDEIDEVLADSSGYDDSEDSGDEDLDWVDRWRESAARCRSLMGSSPPPENGNYVEPATGKEKVRPVRTVIAEMPSREKERMLILEL